MRQPPSKPIVRIVQIGLGAAVLGFGLYISDFGAPRLAMFGLALFALPLLLQLLRRPLARAYALWLGAFLVLQAVMAPILLGDAAYLILNSPNTTETTNFVEGAVPGITGLQRVTFGERGFRVQPPVDYDRKSGVRIFAIGGSTTEETWIGEEATWTHRLQIALASGLGRPVEVINAGVRGQRSRHHVAMLRHILPLQPDIVLFLVGFNDWHFDALSRFGSDSPPRRVLFPDTPLGRLARVQFNRVFRPAELRGEPVVISTNPRVGGSLQRERKISWFPEAASEQYLSNLATISRICRDSALTCVFLTQPTAHAQDAPKELTDLFWITPVGASYTLTLESLEHIAKVYNRALIDFAMENEHPFCDVAAQLPASIEYFYDDVHYTLAGSARVAELVAGCVKPIVAEFR
jgi:lysophospholipase L1-like esterase